MFKLQIYSSLVSFLILASCTTARLQPIQSETTVFSSFLAGSYASRIKESQFRSDYLTTAFEYSDFEVSLGQKAISSAIVANNLALAHQHAEVINKKDKNENEVLKEEEILFDIFSLNNLETESVRLSASTIKQLFEDTGYDLNDVRKKKLVKPVALTLLPQEIKMIENTKKRKEFFIQIVLPLIIQENNNIKLDRKTLFSIINKNNNSNSEKKWLDKKYKQYGIKSKDLSTLKIRMDEIPVSLAIAQAAKETGWGTSRFAQEGNALFGQWTWSGEGLKPKEAKEGEGHKVMKFNILQASVRAYQRNLNTHSTYKGFRKARAKLRDLNKPLDSIELSKHLNKYAETGNQYVEVLQKIIKQNKLQDFDDAKLLPSSVDLESLI